MQPKATNACHKTKAKSNHMLTVTAKENIIQSNIDNSSAKGSTILLKILEDERP